ncbi:hypothetical protein R3P38DRAFT_2791904 [Favolaschia claudopus]|uniref:F-box domain-containing protein n=1 Tax=Favolaschia claudopus TaxID=2862362 RepID=A0AAW0AHI2_9AGAR
MNAVGGHDDKLPSALLLIFLLDVLLRSFTGRQVWGLGATILELRSAVHYWTTTLVFRPQQLSPVHTLFTMDRYFTLPTKTTLATPPVFNADLAASGTSSPHNTFPPRSRPEQHPRHLSLYHRQLATRLPPAEAAFFDRLGHLELDIVDFDDMENVVHMILPELARLISSSLYTDLRVSGILPLQAPVVGDGGLRHVHGFSPSALRSSRDCLASTHRCRSQPWVELQGEAWKEALHGNFAEGRANNEEEPEDLDLGQTKFGAACSRTYRYQTRAALSVTSLPKEVLHRIAGFVPSRFDSDPSSWMDNIHRLRAVCRIWREVVLTDPTFFSKILVHSKKRPDCIRDWLDASGTTDLTMFFALGCDGEDAMEDYVAMRDLSNILAPCMHRCQKIYYHAHTPMGTNLLFGMLKKLDAEIVPVLHLVAEDDLTIHFPQIFISASTRVQHVVAQRCALGILPPSLTSLQLSDVSPDFDLTGTQIRDALSAAPALKHLLVHRRVQADFLRIIDLPELLHLVLHVEDHEVFETVSKSLNHGSKAVKVELTITSGCLHCMRSFFRAMPELRWLHITGSDDHVETVIGALVLSSPDVFRSVRRMEFGNQLDKELVVDFAALWLPDRHPVGVISRASNVVEGHVDLQRICMQDGDNCREIPTRSSRRHLGRRKVVR